MKIIILRGIKGSGKTEYAASYESDYSCWSVSKSAIRRMLYDGPYGEVREKIVREVYWAAVDSLIRNGDSNTTILLDNLHIQDMDDTIEKIKDIIFVHYDDDFSAEIRVVTFRPTIEEAINNVQRDNPELSLGFIKNLITRQYNMAMSFGIYTENKKGGINVYYEDHQ